MNMQPFSVRIYPRRTKGDKYKLFEVVTFGDWIPAHYPYRRILRNRTRLWQPAKLPNGRGMEFETPAAAIEFYMETTK